ncbi:MAG: 4-hydroxy-tetrahydrodipicolinate reductase [Gemmataceae bacterium]
MPTTLAIFGATGRVGRRLVALASQDPALKVVAAVASPESAHLGTDAGELAGVNPINVPIRDRLEFGPRIDCAIDFSTPDGTLTALKACVSRRIPLVVATTGHEALEKQEIEAAAHETAILLSPNTSLVVNLLFKLSQLTGESLAGRGFDVEIIERHHRHKKDSPSGTAMQFARIIQQEMGQLNIQHGREGILGERPLAEIGIHAVRAGDNVGEHTIIFAAPGETLELVHKGTSRDSYARGALTAAQFLAGKGAGRYTMADVLGL